MLETFHRAHNIAPYFVLLLPKTVAKIMYIIYHLKSSKF